MHAHRAGREDPVEHSEELKPGGYRFFYDDRLFPPGTDTFLLSSLPRLKPGLRVCDLGCGTGLLGLLLLQRQPAVTVTGVELLPEAVELGRRAAAVNGLTDRLLFRQGDLRDVRSLLPAGGFDLAVCNPPYYSPGAGALPRQAPLRTARAETACSLADVCRAAAYLLRWGGSFCLVHKPERLTDLFCALRPAGLEPKVLRLVEQQPGRAPSLVLVESRRGGHPGLTVRPPLVLQAPDGTPTREADAIYFRTTEDTL